MAHVSVVIPVRDCAPGVQRTLDALARQTLGPEAFETIVVDDGSRDGTAAVVERTGARLVRLDRSRGSYHARNRGLAVAGGAVVAFTDADCRPAADWLERGLAALDGLGADLVGGRIDTPLGPRPTLAQCVDVARGLDQERCVLEWGFAATANLLVRRCVLDAVGVFNAELRSGGDDELSRRAVAAGFRLRYAADVVVEHEPRVRARAVAGKAFRVGRGGGHLRWRGEGPARARPRLWTRPRAWRPRHGLLGAERLADQGHRLSAARRIALDAAQWALVQVPTAAGDLWADLEHLASRR